MSRIVLIAISAWVLGVFDARAQTPTPQEHQACRKATTPFSSASSNTVSGSAGHAGRLLKSTECNAARHGSRSRRCTGLDRLTASGLVCFPVGDAPRLPL